MNCLQIIKRDLFVRIIQSSIYVLIGLWMLFRFFDLTPYIYTYQTLFSFQKKFSDLLFVLFVGFGIVAMVDFWKWEYQYGHDLNPDAAIKVPGMSYQPPLIGYKQLLNFGAYSMPDIGGWIFILAGLILVVIIALQFRKAKSVY